MVYHKKLKLKVYRRQTRIVKGCSSGKMFYLGYFKIKHHSRIQFPWVRIIVTSSLPSQLLYSLPVYRNNHYSLLQPFWSGRTGILKMYTRDNNNPINNHENIAAPDGYHWSKSSGCRWFTVINQKSGLQGKNV